MTSLEIEKLSMEETQAKYNQLCAEAGDLQYKISMLGERIDIINDILEGLNTHAAELIKAKKTEEEKEVKSE